MSEKEDPIVDVIFRKYRDGNVIALFPGLGGDMDGATCSSYMRIGQHGAAHLSHVMRTTLPAEEKEYAALKRELESKPFEYKFNVIKRATRAHGRARTEQLKR
jgi:hypothetical protein